MGRRWTHAEEAQWRGLQCHTRESTFDLLGNRKPL